MATSSVRFDLSSMAHAINYQSNSTLQVQQRLIDAMTNTGAYTEGLNEIMQDLCQQDPDAALLLRQIDDYWTQIDRSLILISQPSTSWESCLEELQKIGAIRVSFPQALVAIKLQIFHLLLPTLQYLRSRLPLDLHFFRMSPLIYSALTPIFQQLALSDEEMHSSECQRIMQPSCAIQQESAQWDLLMEWLPKITQVVHF